MTLSSSFSPAQQALLDRLETNPQTGLTNDQVTERREQSGRFNVVKPPIDCPPTVCCLLPCIKHMPSMKAFASLQPDDAEVLRESKWIRYDVTSLVCGDIVRLEEGDVVPADCVVLDLTTAHSRQEELLVDVRAITAEDKPRSAKRVTRRNAQGQETTVVQPVQLYWGGTVVQGGCLAVVTAIGTDCLISTLIAQGKFPPPPNVLMELGQNNATTTYLDEADHPAGQNNNEPEGISLVQAQQREALERETV